MNAAQFRHAAVHFDVAEYLGATRPDVRWVLEYDHLIIKGGRSIEYIIDLAGLDKETKIIEFAVEIAATTQHKDGKEKHSSYEHSKIPFYLLVDCASGVCSLYRHNGSSYQEIDVLAHFPGLPEVVAKTMAEATKVENN